jgi:hypothetical protein
VREAIDAAFSELDSERPRREAELGRIAAELKRTGAALDRYFRAFEAGTMPERACGARIDALTEKLRGLEARRDELAVDGQDEPEPLSDDDVRLLQAEVREVIADGDPPARKALLQALVHEIRVVSRAEIYPSFSLPAVRPPSGSARPEGFEPPASCSVDRCPIQLSYGRLREPLGTPAAWRAVTPDGIGHNELPPRAQRSAASPTIALIIARCPCHASALATPRSCRSSAPGERFATFGITRSPSTPLPFDERSSQHARAGTADTRCWSRTEGSRKRRRLCAYPRRCEGRLSLASVRVAISRRTGLPSRTGGHAVAT